METSHCVRIQLTDCIWLSVVENEDWWLEIAKNENSQPMTLPLPQCVVGDDAECDPDNLPPVLKRRLIKIAQNVSRYWDVNNSALWAGQFDGPLGDSLIEGLNPDLLLSQEPFFSLFKEARHIIAESFQSTRLLRDWWRSRTNQ